MSIVESNKVDLIGDDIENNLVCLGISDHLDWNDVGSHLRILEAKINAYLEFIENGQLIEERPDALGKAIKIELLIQHDVPDFVAKKYYTAIEKTLLQAGHSFSYYKI
ncbi:hypothetical protein JWG40_08145 [Leptospira sp. 201903074]|uniref:DUF6572 domain-containing protein n=1 Tax=Leptospira abararensis TaxID=2810036 RepID=UPI001963D16F|nr:DUF6572 domain-containing protein [Leptospira abararensis]MBM9546984.1 hypothetical protein [Leptospira abararensis]